jgi:superfamily II DNA helicase RecQ
MNIKVFNIRLNKEYCQVDQDRMNDFLQTVQVNLTSTSFVTTNTSDYWSAVVFYSPKKVNKERNVIKDVTVDLATNEQVIFNALRKWRNDLAMKLDWSPYRICHNVHLIAIAKANPNSVIELEKITGFGSARIMKYGDDIMAVLNAL